MKAVAEAIAELLRSLDFSEVSSWHYCGNIGFKVQGWYIELFIDCDELDYVDHAIAPNGTRYEFEQFVSPEYWEPLTTRGMLTDAELKAIKEKLLCESAP